MMDSKLFDLLFAILPAIIVGGVAYYFFAMHTKNEEGRRRFLLHKENQTQSLPLRLQAYERMSLFLERIAPGKLLLRITPIGDDKKAYESLLIDTIEQEFEHNFTQQIYVSEECWNIIKAAKNGTIAWVRKATEQKESTDANAMRTEILKIVIEKGTPSDLALAFIKSEVGELF